MIYHNLNPEIASLGPFTFYWYGLMYAVSFVMFYFIVKYLANQRKLKLGSSDIESLMIWMALGMFAGARLFEVLVYNPLYYVSNPLDIFAVWRGGLSFHGGLAGVVVAGWIYSRKKGISFLKIADLFVIPLGIALFLGRIGNFINGELYGRITSVQWCVKFPGAEGCRHPSQLYEAAKNLVIFGVIWSIKDRKLPDGFLFASFLVMYGVLRFFIEFAREPTSTTFNPGFITMGQMLCIIMIAAGAWMMHSLGKKSPY